jgi:hypothetical protein
VAKRDEASPATEDSPAADADVDEVDESEGCCNGIVVPLVVPLAADVVIVIVEEEATGADGRAAAETDADM